MADIIGMDIDTGESITGVEHLKQSIRDILTTPVGSRVMRRDYGSNLMTLLDRPMNSQLAVDVQIAVTMALSLQEPRLQLNRVTVELPSDDPVEGASMASDGRLRIHIEGTVLPEGEQIVIEDVLNS
jgi:phage baseplate assembly protein W